MARNVTRPCRPLPAEEKAIGIDVLAASDRGLVGLHAAVGVAPGRERRLCPGAAWAVPVGGNEEIMELGVARVLGERPGEIAEVAVQIDVALGHPADMGEAVGIDGVHKQRRDRLRLGADDALLDEPGLAGRAAKALIAMRARDDDQEGLGLQAAKPGDVDGELFAVEAPGVGIDMGFDLGAAGPGGVEKFLARLPIDRRKMLRNSHGGRFPTARA